MKTCMDYRYVISTSHDVLVILTPFSRSQKDRKTEDIPEDILTYLKTKHDRLYQHINDLE